MKNNIKNKLRIAGISLRQVAKATKTHPTTVCNVLDDQLRKRIESKAREMLVEKKEEFERELKEID